MFGNVKQLMEMKKQAEQMKRELENVTIDVSDVEGIKIAISGAQKFRSITIDQSLLTVENKSKLENDLLRSLNAAISKSQNTAAQKMRDVAGLNLPGM